MSAGCRLAWRQWLASPLLICDDVAWLTYGSHGACVVVVVVVVTVPPTAVQSGLSHGISSVLRRMPLSRLTRAHLPSTPTVVTSPPLPLMSTSSCLISAT